MEKTSSNNNQKALGFLLILFLSVTYKDMVLDPYLRSKNALPGAVNPAPVNTQATQPAANPTSAQQAVPNLTIVKPGEQNQFPSDLQIDEAGYIELQNEELYARVSLLGGRIRELRLKKFKDQNTKESLSYNIVSHIDLQPLPLGVKSGDQRDTWVKYTSTEVGPNAFSLIGKLPDGRTVTKNLALSPKGYAFDFSVDLSQPAKNGERVEVEWNRFLAKDSVDFKDSQSTGGFVWFDGTKAHRETYNSFKSPLKVFGSSKWISSTDHYFVISIISSLAPGISKAEENGELFTISMSGEPTRGDFKLIASPKSYGILSSMGDGLERNIDFGITGFLSAPLLAMLNLFFGFLGNYGLAIVALTIVVRLVLLPLNAASFKSMKAMQDLQPEVQKLKESIQDKQEQQQAMMALYKKKGVNPLGGCLPMLLQLPIFLGLYSALLLAVELRHAPFAAWIHDLSAPEQLMFGSIGIPVMVILFVGSMLYQQWSTPSTMDETQKKIMLIMPVVFGFVFFIHMPAGLTLYWLTSNIISIVQMRELRKEGKHNAFLITTAVAGLVFVFAFVLTKVA
jgi:YidC/Oxa1 family membrane protein insertase